MSGLSPYKCPSCGGAVPFKAILRNGYECPSCGVPMRVRYSDASILGAAVMGAVFMGGSYHKLVGLLLGGVVAAVGLRLVRLDVDRPPS